MTLLCPMGCSLAEWRRPPCLGRLVDFPNRTHGGSLPHLELQRLSRTSYTPPTSHVQVTIGDSGKRLLVSYSSWGPEWLSRVLHGWTMEEEFQVSKGQSCTFCLTHPLEVEDHLLVEKNCRQLSIYKQASFHFREGS